MHRIENLEAQRARLAREYGIPLLELTRARRPAAPPPPPRRPLGVDELRSLYWWRS